MSQQSFAKLIKSNVRDTSKIKGDFPEQAAYNTPHVKSFYTPMHYQGEHAMFTKDALDKSYDKYGGGTTKGVTTKRGNAIRYAEKVGTGKNTTYVFHWYAKFGRGLGGLQAVNEGSRKHIAELLEIMGQKPLPQGDLDKLIGGHLEASSFLSILRKGVGEGVITEEQARVYYDAFMKGNLNDVLKHADPDPKIENKNVKTAVGKDQIGMSYEQIKKVNEKTHDIEFTTEMIIPLPSFYNEGMSKEFETPAATVMKNELNGIAGIKWVDDPGSPSIINMYQEIIAAKLLGKKAPKYNTKNTYIGSKFKSDPKGKTKYNKIPKGKRGKRQESKVQKAKFKNQLRTSAGQFASPTALKALLNKKLPQTIIENMGYPSLRNITGKFAESAQVINITQSKNTRTNIPAIQYTYEEDPYSVFEMGAKGAKPWATPGRDPRGIIDASIREIAQEMMINKFNTQRL